jgi:CRISPR-associated protein Cas5d
MNRNWVSVRVRGDFALFTRPENKVERVSYPIMTPSAARGILEAIFWHPQFRWAVREIHVLKEPKTLGILRNEVNSKMSATRPEPYFADEDRTQRHSVCLCEVDYVIWAEPEMKDGESEHPQKYREQFQRRVDRGQCFHRPALGCREFAAEFEPVSGTEQPIEWTEDLGLMLLDLDYASKPPYWPKFFEAKVEAGVMLVREPVGGFQ